MEFPGHTSEGVRRVMAAARQSASKLAGTEVSTKHVLAALWHDQSRAHEILVRAGVTEDVAADHIGTAEWNSASTPDDGSFTSSANDHLTPEDIPLSSKVRSSVREAQSLAGQLGRHAEMGTEHLLIGLVAADEELAAWLEGCHVGLETLRDDAATAAGLTDEPISVDISLRPAVRSGRETVRIDRILDAAANRCREGLRVVEDFVRFVMDDAQLTRLLKQHRHDLAAALSLLPGDRMLAARDTAGDVGTAIQTLSEQYREHVHDVVRASCKRIQESLRTLEEYSKTLNPDASVRFEQLRYRFYTIEQAVTQTLRSRDRLADARLYLLVTDRLCPQGAGPMIRAALQAGVDIIQLREKQMPDRQLLDLAISVREWTSAFGALFIVNDRPDIAALSHADGVHLGQDDMSVRDARQIVGGDKLIGVSTHSIEQARQAVIEGADYLGVGPVFPSQTKSFDEFPGLLFVKEVAAEITRPWYPLGGLDENNIADVIAAGATRAAVSGAVISAKDPASVITNLNQQLSDATPGNPVI